MGSGKSTASKYILETDARYKHINFKDGLVAEMKECLPDVLRELVDIYYDPVHGLSEVDDLFDKKPKAMRALMRNYGTEVRRRDSENYWVDRWLKTVREHTHVVTDDVRFLNEAATVRSAGGTVIRIIRTDISDTGVHASEKEMEQIDVDHTIVVDKGQFSELYDHLDVIIKGLR